MIDVKKFDKDIELELWQAVNSFNAAFKKNPKEVLKKGYYELWEMDKNIDLYVWRVFYTDSRVREFYKKEFELGLDAKKQILLQQVGENKSTATNQALVALLKREEENQLDPNDNKIFVYSFIPLNENERNADNVKILENIPEGIRDAITIVEGNKNKK